MLNVRSWRLVACFLLGCATTTPAIAEEPVRDYTCFQTASGYAPELDIGSDEAIVYGVNDSLAARLGQWRDHGYAVSLMTGVAWGGYGAYFGTGPTWKRDEIQTRKNGSLFLHEPNSETGYNVPTLGYVQFMKELVQSAVDQGIRAVYMEEPEYWAETGWSPAFQNEWQAFYGEAWQAPDSSVDAQYRASKLKYELYYRALKEVFAGVDERAAAQNRTVDCIVPTHSLISYAQWRIVSPESHLIDIPQLDGYVAQVWTGTARTPNRYQGVQKERTFETGYLEYAQMVGMVRPTGRKVWFLADPVEDNPNRSWNDYKLNYECTIIASLMWPEVHRYEVMPWPSRIFQGAYPKVDMSTKSGEREGIPSEYATQILTVINALNEMDQTEVKYQTGTRGVGVIVSDTLMFQRAAPSPSDPSLGSFYALSMPLLKVGVPVEVVQLENTIHPGTLEPYQVLLLTYDGQKPLKPEYHEVLDRWVRAGGGLIFVDDGSDPYNGVREWWNDQGRTNAKPEDDLFRRLAPGAAEAGTFPAKAQQIAQPVGKGWVRVLRERPSDLLMNREGADTVRGLVKDLLRRMGKTLKTQNYLSLRRGPFLVASVLDESISEKSLRLKGLFVDLFQPSLPVLRERVLKPNERTLLYDLDWARRHGVTAKVVGAGTRVRGEELNGARFSFHTRGPQGTTANARILLPSQPVSLSTLPEIAVEQKWDSASSTLWLSFPNTAQEVTFALEW